jgi:hypothetical protein
MHMADPAQNKTPFVELLGKFLFTGELIFTALAIAGLALHFSGTTVEPVLMLSLSALAAVYFLSAFQMQAPPAEGDKGMRVLLPVLTVKVAYIGMAVCCIGVMFATLGMPGSAQMLLIGTASVALVTLVNALLAAGNSSRPNRLRGLIIRGTAVSMLSGYFLSRSLEELL